MVNEARLPCIDEFDLVKCTSIGIPVIDLGR